MWSKPELTLASFFHWLLLNMQTNDFFKNLFHPTFTHTVITYHLLSVVAQMENPQVAYSLTHKKNIYGWS